MPDNNKKPKKLIKKKSKIGKWTLIKPLGEGGNGVVWSCKDDKGSDAAIKFLKNLETDKYQRFRFEISVVETNSDIDGLMQIYDKNLPEDFEHVIPPFYVMPIGKPVLPFLEGKTLREKVLFFIHLSEIVSKLHERNISHRDIKPSNLLMIDNKCYLSDFGLVDFAGKPELTRTNERIGPKGITPAEMIHDPKNADGLKADIYELAKTLWILLTGQVEGFEGQYNQASKYGLENYFVTNYITPINKLLFNCTDPEPVKRPNIQEFVTQLKSWCDIDSNFEAKNIAQWKELNEFLFADLIPTEAIWEETEDIIEVLKLLTKQKNLNHLFFPDGGGHDLIDARVSDEPGCIEIEFPGINDQRSVHIIKPKRLIFQTFKYKNEWNYFRIETEKLDPVDPAHLGGVSDEFDDILYEDVIKVSAGSYVPVYSVEEFYQQHPNHIFTTEDLVSRWVGGVFVIFGKNSPYNKISATYDGRHNKMDKSEFRDHVKKLIFDFEMGGLGLFL